MSKNNVEQQCAFAANTQKPFIYTTAAAVVLRYRESSQMNEKTNEPVRYVRRN
jgi:hypothetical protein